MQLLLAAAINYQAPPPAHAAEDILCDKLEDLIGHPVKYGVFEFPSPAVAQLKCATGVRARDGKFGIRWDRVLAVGKVRLPTNSSMQITLKYDGLEKLQSLDCLKECRVNCFSAASLDFEDRHMQYLKNFKNLQILDFDDTLISDASLPFIGQQKNLVALRAIKTNITGAGFDNLLKLKNLTELKIAGTSLKPGNIQKLKPLMPQLRFLDLSATNLSKQDATIFKSLADIRLLNVSLNNKLDNDCLKYLLCAKKLTNLSIDDTAINDGCIPDLLKMPELQVVVVRAKTFWKTRNPRGRYNRITFLDHEQTSNAPAEVFTPLH